MVDPKRIKESLVQAGIEVFRTRPDEIHIAERVRSHMMDSGVRLHFDAEGKFEVRFTARAEASGYPHVASSELLQRVREVVGVLAVSEGFGELSACSVDVKDPSDKDRTLDVWHEVAYTKHAVDLDEAVRLIQWALAVDRYVMP